MILWVSRIWAGISNGLYCYSETPRTCRCLWIYCISSVYLCVCTSDLLILSAEKEKWTSLCVHFFWQDFAQVLWVLLKATSCSISKQPGIKNHKYTFLNGLQLSVMSFTVLLWFMVHSSNIRFPSVRF